MGAGDGKDHVPCGQPFGLKVATCSRLTLSGVLSLFQRAWLSLSRRVNAYTRAAQFEGLSAEASYRVQKVGGMVLGMAK